MTSSIEMSAAGQFSSREADRLRDEVARLRAERDLYQARATTLQQQHRLEHEFASALWESEHHLPRALFEAPFPVIIHAEDGEVIALNRVWTELTGYGLEDIPTVDAWVTKAYDEMGVEMQARIDRLYDLDTRVDEGEYTLRTKDGRSLVWSFSSAPLGRAADDGRRLVITMATDVTARTEAEKALQIKDFAIESALSGIAIASLAGRLIYVNEALLRMWRYERAEEALGRRVFAFWRDIREAQQVGRILREKGRWSGELVARRRDGTEFVALLSANMVPDGDGEPLFFMASFIDITDRKEIEAQLRSYATDLEARTDELDAFTQMVAHDLTNPLARVIGYAELLEQSHAEMTADELEKHLHTVAQAGRQANQIIQELLLLAHVRQVDDIEIAALDMGEIVGEVLERLELLTAKYEPEIILPETWPAALGYAPWIAQVWENYLSNALKYGGRPPRVELGSTVEADGAVRYWVRDNGSGIPRKDWPDLFAPFSRLARTPGAGHGLGLSIAKHIAEKLGGSVGVDSVPGTGSCFSFTLPPVSPTGPSLK